MPSATLEERTPPTSDHHSKASTPLSQGCDAASKGASLAFGLSRPEAKHAEAPDYMNGALAAAITAGNRSRQQDSIKPRTRKDTLNVANLPVGTSTYDRKKAELLSPNGFSNVALETQSRNRSISPSNIAAAVAASRSTPRSVSAGKGTPLAEGPSRRPGGSPGGKQRDRGHSQTANPGIENMSRSKVDVPRVRGAPDSTSIAPTASLIGMFEQQKQRPGERDTATGPIKSKGVAPLIKSPKPVRPLPPGSPLNVGMSQTQGESSSAVSTTPLPSPASANRGSKQDRMGNSPQEKTQPVRNDTPSLNHQEHAAASKNLFTTAPDKEMVEKKQAPEPPPARRPGRMQRSHTVDVEQVPRQQKVQRSSRASSNRVMSESFGRSTSVDPTTESTRQTHPPVPSPRHKSLAPSPRAEDVPLVQRRDGSSRPSQNKPAMLLDEDSLANAIVASTLASSRAPSPSKVTAPPLPRRQSKTHLFPHHHHHHHQQQSRLPDSSRTPSPVKGMRHTMRKPAKSDDETENVSGPHRKGRKHFMKKAPNKHHEGDRKRWRDSLTERERKRYEGVWAANRGHLLSGGQSPTHIHDGPVLGLVVRDVWSRSRLGADELEEVWNLVDKRHDGLLNREEFVVGMWLIDQRLKGRKLPMLVSASVWDSVKKLGGVKVR
ncbi:MAG: Increased rDNA silencing protein [Piccolia ochrophora]|nr:MAG: Increased rDNA silencing protein [Piccolia ochrophora]